MLYPCRCAVVSRNCFIHGSINAECCNCFWGSPYPLVLNRYFGQLSTGIRNEGGVTRAKLQMEEIAKSLRLYKLDSGVYPTTEQGLLALVVEPCHKPKPRKWKQYLDKVPYDPWSEPYLYKCPGIEHEKNAAGYFRTNKEIYDPSPLSDMKTGSLAPHLRINAEIYDNFVLTCTGADGVEGSEDDIRTVVDDESD